MARDEALLVAAFVALVGGYMDAYTLPTSRPPIWCSCGFMSRQQSGQRRCTTSRRLAAFVVGVIMASFLRHLAPRRAAQISVVIEITFLFFIAIIHRGLPELAGTLGISFVAALQAASFPQGRGMGLQLRDGDGQFSSRDRGPVCGLRLSRAKPPSKGLCVRTTLRRIWDWGRRGSSCGRPNASIWPRHSRDIADDCSCPLWARQSAQQGLGAGRVVLPGLI